MATKFTHYGSQIIYATYINIQIIPHLTSVGLTRMKEMLHVMIILVSCYQYRAISIGLRSQLHSSFFKKI